MIKCTLQTFQKQTGDWLKLWEWFTSQIKSKKNIMLLIQITRKKANTNMIKCTLQTFQKQTGDWLKLWELFTSQIKSKKNIMLLIQITRKKA